MEEKQENQNQAIEPQKSEAPKLEQEIQPQIENKEIKEKKYYKCTVPGCEMIFSKKCVLRDHQMAHKKEKPFKCQTCGKQFTQRGNLKTHEKYI